MINELMPHPSPGNDWIEIYNPTSNNIDLANWILVDSTSTMKTLSGTVNTNGFITFDVSKRLNNSGDSIYLKDASGNTIDNYSYNSDPGINKSIGRNPDGGTWTILTSSSNGLSNGGSSPTPTLLPTPSSTSTPTPSSTFQPSLFTISDIHSQINSDQSFNVSINLFLPENPNTNFYLKGAFKKSDSSNYFGQTLVSGNWIKNGSSYSDQFSITTNGLGNWSGNLEVKPDSSDLGFTGTGDYIFKVGKYNAAKTSPSVSWSDNESTIKIISTNTQSSSVSTVSPSSSSTPSDISTSNKKRVLASAQPKRLNEINYRIASVAAATTSASTSSAKSTQVSVKDQKKQTNPFLWAGFAFILLGTGSVGYIILKKNGKIPF